MLLTWELPGRALSHDHNLIIVTFSDYHISLGTHVPSDVGLHMYC